MQYIAGVYDHADPSGDEQSIQKGSFIADHSCRNLIETFERGRQTGLDLRTSEVKQIKAELQTFKRRTVRERATTKREEREQQQRNKAAEDQIKIQAAQIRTQSKSLVQHQTELKKLAEIKLNQAAEIKKQAAEIKQQAAEIKKQASVIQKQKEKLATALTDYDSS